MRLVRRLVFYLFAAAYLIGCPLTIAYALGYLYEPGTEHGLVQTGLIALSTEPPGATVYLNNKRYTKKTPTLLRGLLPGAYQLRVSLRDHQAWTRTVTVEGAKAAAYEHILLAPSAWRPETVVAEQFEQLVPLSGDRFAVLLAGPTLGEAMVLDVRERQPRPLLPVLSPWRQARLIDQLAVAGAPALLARVEVRGGERLIWLDVRSEDTAIEDVSQYLLTRPVWAGEPSGKRRFVLFDDGTLAALDDPARSVLATDVRGAGLAGHRLYVLDASGRLDRMDLEGRDRETLLQHAPLGRRFFGAHGFFRIVAPDDRLLLLWSEQGRLLTNRLPYRFAREGITGLAPDPRTSRVLLWRRHALGVLDDGPVDEDPAAFARGPRLRWLIRGLTRVEQAYWAYDASHALVLDADMLRLVEIDVDAPTPSADVVPVKRKTSVLYTESEGAVYFLSAADGHLMRLALLPRRERLSLTLPARRELTVPPGVRR